MDEFYSLDGVIQDLASQVETTRTKAKKKVKKKKTRRKANNDENRSLETPDLPSDLELSFDAPPVFRPVLTESANRRVAPRDSRQSLAVTEDLLASLRKLQLSGGSRRANGDTRDDNSDSDNLSDILADLGDSPVTVKKRPLKTKATGSTRKTSRKNILRPQLGSTSTPNNDHIDGKSNDDNDDNRLIKEIGTRFESPNLLIPKIETRFESPRLEQISIGSAEQFSDSGTHGSSDILFSSMSDVQKTFSHDIDRLLKVVDSRLGEKTAIPIKTERSPINLDLPDLSLGSLSSKPSTPGLSSTRRSVQDDSYDLPIEMSRISGGQLDDTELLESSEEPVKFPRKLVTNKLDDTELLETSDEELGLVGRKTTGFKHFDDTEILESSNEERNKDSRRNSNGAELLEDEGDFPVSGVPKLTRLVVVESQSLPRNEFSAEARYAARPPTDPNPREIFNSVDEELERSVTVMNDRCVQAELSLSSTDSDREKSVSSEERSDLDLDLDLNSCDSDLAEGDDDGDGETAVDREVQADFSRLSSSSVDSESETGANSSAASSVGSTTVSPEPVDTVPHKLSFSESPAAPSTPKARSTVDESAERLSSSSSDDDLERFLNKVRDVVKEEVVDEAEDEDDFIVSDSEDVIRISSSGDEDDDADDDRSSSADLPRNPYLTPPEYLYVASAVAGAPTGSSTSPSRTAFKTPRECRVVRFSSDSDDDYLPDLAGSPRPRSSSSPRPPPATPASVYKTARPPPKNDNKSRLLVLSNRSKPVVTFSSSDSEEEVAPDKDQVFEPDRTRAPLVKFPTIRSNSTSDLLNSTPVAPLPASLRNKGGKTVSSILVGKLPANHDHYDFLKSLGKEVPPLKIHPEALKYVRNFKHTKDELSQKLMRMFNERVFDNKLRDRVPVIWNKRLTQTAGYCVNSRDKTSQAHTARIELSTKVCDSAERVRDTLLHEACHAATWLLDQKRDGHGPYWKRWAHIAHLKYPQLPMVTRCHSYYIETKYIYKCRKCGYSVNRHSKSLNTTRKVCGFCKGDFDLYARQKDGSLSRVADDQALKTPLNKFAQFVKDNYGSVKSVSTTKKHRDVMQTLSKEFAAKNKIQT